MCRGECGHPSALLNRELDTAKEIKNVGESL
ncbi:hypothetical protein SAMN05444369_1143 [Capnocytophaga haemolytica]|uniref:Uncharacterized protein n=1 Tax=Capnocytophaga haemolytica TaxID=45243 RepID=A0AAX2GZM6_9FLAO|nr:hypothetical protein SAMN05444369_1143 [Capnocytophaga haemolytica]SNV09747.1 Uncharacterised protein [Capnocytophaga haemolytica]